MVENLKQKKIDFREVSKLSYCINVHTCGKVSLLEMVAFATDYLQQKKKVQTLINKVRIFFNQLPKPRICIWKCIYHLKMCNSSTQSLSDYFLCSKLQFSVDFGFCWKTANYQWVSSHLFGYVLEQLWNVILPCLYHKTLLWVVTWMSVWVIWYSPFSVHVQFIPHRVR